MKVLLAGTAVALSVALGASTAAGTKSVPRERVVSAQSPLAGAVQMAVAKPAPRSVAKVSQPHQGYRCPSGGTAGSQDSPPAGAAVIKSFRLIRIRRPTPTSAVLRVDATVAAPAGAELSYTYTTTGGRTTQDGRRATWTLEEAGIWTISLEVYNRASGCATFTSATYTVPKSRRNQTKTSGTNMTPAKPQWEIDYEQRMAVYEQELAKQRQAVADYERQKAEVEARREELRLRAEATQAQWRAAVAACQAGDYSQCGGGPR
jgi:hypothetical protein